MTEVVQSALDLVARVLLSFLAAGCLVISAYMFARWLRTIVLRQLQRVALTFFLQRRRRPPLLHRRVTGALGQRVSHLLSPPVGEATLSPLQEALTNTLRFADIVVHTNGTATLSIAWPSSLLTADATLDLFAATSLVNAAWRWQCEHQVAAGETNWLVAVTLPQTGPGTNAPSAFFYVSNRETSADTMADSDGDGLPDVYELAHGTNPYVPDYASASKLTVGPGGNFTDIQSSLAASTDYSIIELDPSVRHEIRDSLGVQLPQHPVMVTASNPYAVVRATGTAAFMLATNTTSRTLFRNLYLLLAAQDSFQIGFWCGGNMPWKGVPASATFDNVYMRIPTPNVQYRGWMFYRSCDDPALIRDCTLNAAGATWAVGVDAYGSPPLMIDGCSFINFPPDTVSSTSCGVFLRTSGTSDEGSEVTISRSLFDESFTNAWPLARFDSTNSYSVTISDCLAPRDLPSEYLPDVSTNISVMNAMLTWSGIPHSYSPSVALGVGALALVTNDPSVDTDGDGLSDYDEAYVRGIDPFNPDSDNDGVDDRTEIFPDGTDPTNPHSFMQRLSVTATNTTSTACATYVAWGSSETGWETNGLRTLARGFGETVFTNAASQGATHIKAFYDLNGSGEYETNADILLVRSIPVGATVQVIFVFGDVDGDGVSDTQERREGTDPYDKRNYGFDMSVSVTGIFRTTNSLTLVATFGDTTLCGPLAMMANAWFKDFGFLVATNNEQMALTFWDDANSNGVCDAGETFIRQPLPVTNRTNAISLKLSYGPFDASGNGLPDWWEVQTGLAAEGVAKRMYDDPDGDGLINLHEYWSGTNPLLPDGSNTLLSVVSRSIDDRIRGVDPAVAIPRFVDYFVNSTNGIFVVNTNFWARDLDLSCVNVWHNEEHPGTKAATLITRKHVVMSAHWYANVYKFCDTNGTVLTRTVVDKKGISDDLLLGQLNMPLPNSFKPAHVLSTNVLSCLAAGRYLPVLCFNQVKGATVLELAKLDDEITVGGGNRYRHYGNTSHTNLVSSQRSAVRGATVDGNSGCPVFLVVDNELVLLFSKHLGILGVETWSPFWGPMLPFRLEAIQQKIDEWEGDDADLYQIVPFDFSSFGEIVNQ